jgi:hypothetical protein
MGSFNRVFDPLDLEIIDRVYEAVWAELEAREPFRDRNKDGERGEELRQRIFVVAASGEIDFDSLCDRVLANTPALRKGPYARSNAGGATATQDSRASELSARHVGSGLAGSPRGSQEAAAGNRKSVRQV